MVEGSTAPGVAQTNTLISGAREANVNIGNRATGSTAAEKDSAAITALRARLEKHITPEEVVSEGPAKSAEEPINEKPKSLDDLTWHMVNEPPKDSPAAPHKVLKQESQPTQEKVDLDRALTESLKDSSKTPYLRTLLQAAEQTSRGNGTLPDEVKAFVVLAHHDLGDLDPANTELIPAAFTALRGEGNGTVALHGIDAPYPSQKAADVIIEQALKVSRGPKTQDDLDRMVEVSLACGNPFAAVDLMQKANEFITKPNERVTDSAFSRLAGSGGVFDEALKLYHKRSADGRGTKLDDRMYGVLASIGEGPLEELKKSPEAMAVKKDAERILRGKLAERRDEWYNAQRVSQVEARERALDDVHIETMIEEAVASGKDWKSIDDAIAQRADSVASGKMANFIAAELERRLYPELSIENQMQKAKADARGDYQPMLGYGKYNMLQNAIYGVTYDNANGDEHDQTTPEKEAKVAALGNCTEMKVQRSLLDNKGGAADVASLVQMLHQPASHRGSMQQVDIKFQRREFGNLSEATLLERKQQLADKLVAGTGFLQAVADNAEGRKILETEFGFREIADPSRLKTAQKELQKTFFQAVEQGSDLPANKSQGEEQADEDTRMLTQMSEIKQKEVVALTEEKIATARALVPKMHDNLNMQYQTLVLQQEALANPLKDQIAAQQALARLESQRQAVEETKTVTNRLATWLPANAGTMTEADQEKKLAEITVQTEAQTQRLREIEDQITKLGGVKKDELAALSKRLSDLKRLMPQESTPTASET
ncbi:hypothetical protein COY90_03575 [Candidatus Roizmanbacteria bacterium CG_4_10_14_0_8_um_filter_39_9]|uniref:Uncharacterized protein n=1 Tax=Candidatus Roizmanbacteria bacterium CG_4_10_14_0_8_um_filter_39_9 TaxID=1974829 RepID=A0A2M7QDN7_9BACT|nr:MAG: hypothetical protein COY90_03575 [Candidatus Roizmanbacteria bacterium CG_4_10_14_0_8_um_filter_39_9]